MNGALGGDHGEQWVQLAFASGEGGTPGPDRSRDRLSVDLRGMGLRLHAYAAARAMTVSGVMRAAVLALLGTDAGHQVERAPEVIDVRVVKVSLRLNGQHAAQLANRARAAGVSHGAYVAGLLDGMPPRPGAPDHREAVAALAHSTQKLAVMSADLNAFMRLVREGGIETSNASGAGLISLSEDVRLNLQAVSRLVAELTAERRPRRAPGSVRHHDRTSA